MSHNVPFPAAGGGASSYDDTAELMSIEIPKRPGKADDPRKEQQQQQPRSFHPHQHHQHRDHHHHPRQPGPSSDSYFSSSSGSHGTYTGQPRTPGSVGRHSRNVSTTSAASAAPKSGLPMSQSLSGGPHTGGHPLQQSTQDWQPNQPPSAGGWAGMGGGLPSPSTLTDILLGLHSTLYGGKKSPEEVREMVWRYYDADAIFESPLLAAKGREQVANQFIMAFALPGLDVTSELRDVICSDFEFDGTRAGIIDQTISVTILPSIFGSSSSSSKSPGGASGTGNHSHFAGPHTGTETPGYTLHSAHPSSFTPHPFADYKTPGASAFSHPHTQQHSPTTPFSIASLWGGASSSRPHTPGGGLAHSHMRPFTSSAHPKNDTPPGTLSQDDGSEEDHGPVTSFATAEEAGGGTVSKSRMPIDAVTPHWASQGLGRSTVGTLLWGLFHPRAALKHMCTINLRLMSRLEFNDEGHIVRHEDTWGLRETIEGTIPFASLVYALERRVVGYIASWAVAKGFALSSALHPRAIDGPVNQTDMTLYERQHPKQHQRNADEAAHALLGRRRGSGFHQHEHFQTISRSRAPSPTRMGWSSSATATPYVTGTRSRARSSAGSFYGGSRTASSDNLATMAGSGGAYFASGFERGADKDLPPDSSARYRGLNHRRLEGGSLTRSNSITSAPPHELAGSTASIETFKAPDRDPKS